MALLSALAQVYRAASIADSPGNLQNFLNDLIKTAEQVVEYNEFYLVSYLLCFHMFYFKCCVT